MKPTTNQKEIMDQIISIIFSWKVSGDLTDPSHKSQVQELLSNTEKQIGNPKTFAKISRGLDTLFKGIRSVSEETIKDDSSRTYTTE